MGVIDVSAGFPKVCEKKANEKISTLFEGLNSLTAEQRFEELHKSFQKFEGCTRACLDNFDVDNFIGRNNNQKSDEQLSCMIQGALQGFFLVCAIQEEMKKSPLSRVNGTSSIFAKCADSAIRVEDSLARGIAVYKAEMQRRQKPPLYAAQ